MKKFMLILLAAMGGTVAQAYEYPYLTLQKADGTATSLSVESLVITFSNGQLSATNADGTTTFTLADLSKMLFESSPTAITTAISPSAVTAVTDGAVEVYSTGGMFMGRFDSMEQARCQMRPGIYVMKQNGETKKIAVK